MQVKILIILIVSHLLALVYTQQYYQNRGTKYCGENLANMLQTICDGRLAKKSSSLFKGDTNDGGYGSTKFDFLGDYRLPPWSYSFKSKSAASSLIPKRFRRQTGIVEECCLKPCSINELMGYCE